MAEPKVASIMRQICQAVNELHSNRIIHRDIKYLRFYLKFLKTLNQNTNNNENKKPTEISGFV